MLTSSFAHLAGRTSTRRILTLTFAAALLPTFGLWWLPPASAATGPVDLGTLGYDYSYAAAVNESGQVVGETFNPGAPAHAFSWTSGGGMVGLGTFGGTSSNASAVNDGGQVVGYADLAGDAAGHAFSWTSGGGMV